MSDATQIMYLLALVVLTTPAVLFAVLGLSSLVERKLSEQATSRACQAAIFTGLVAAVGVLAVMIAVGDRHVVIDLGKWVSVHHPGDPKDDYHFQVKFVFDRLSVPMVILSFLLCGTIGAFATRYMHREPGYNRFFVLYAVFLLGMVTASSAGTIETLFTGWELVGLSSALLVAFFQERPAPARNGFRVWVVYRVSDAALLLAAILMHHLRSAGDFDQLLGAKSWPEGETAIPQGEAVLIGLLLLVAAAGKSALIPFSGWLPRAMEGPTPSSAVFYGALSVHLGAYLLLRVSPLFALSPWLAGLVIAWGLATSVYAYIAGSVQTDIKSALSFSSLSQVGIIVAEIGVGAFFPFMWYVALVHLLGHACLRTLQFVRAPTLLADYRALENAIGSRLPRGPGLWVRLVPEGVRTWVYRFGLERGYLDACLNAFVVAPVVRLFRWCDRMERRWTDFLSGRASRESDLVRPHPHPPRIDELP
jgi:NAD(P)H-quinone oxidoreductase subunit 5